MYAERPPNEQLMESRVTDEIWVFANGIPGSGVMGFQPAIFDNQAGQPIWSPFWNHFTLRWQDESAACVLRSSAEVRAALEAGKLAAKGVQVRGIARDPSQFSGNQNVELVAADFTNRREAEQALTGNQVVYLTLPEEGEDPLALETAVGLNAIEAASQVLDRPIQFYEFTNPIPEYVAGFPISERHKELYVELFAYFRRQDYLGEPEEILSVLPDFQYTSVAQFMRSELFVG